MSSLREKIQFYLIDCKTIPGKLIDVAILLLNFIFIAIFISETYNLQQSTRNLLFNLEVIIVFFFIIEYISRIYGASNRIKYIFSIFGIIDFITILPTISIILFPLKAANIGFIKTIRVFKILRIFRFLRYAQDPYFFFGTIKTHLLRVLQLILTILIIFFVSAGLFWQVENIINPNLNNFGDAFYFTVVALTTVGFGDILPLSEAGRWIVVLMIISGIILIPWQAARIIKEWSRMSTKKFTICKKCGLKYHDRDASHCKSCGRAIFQEDSEN